MIGMCGGRGQELDARLDEVLVDAYGDAEQLGSFACVLDELVDGGVPASVLGEPVEVVAVSDEGLMLGLRAKCRRRDATWEVAFVDVDLASGVERELDLTVAAYKRWARGRG